MIYNLRFTITVVQFVQQIDMALQGVAILLALLLQLALRTLSAAVGADVVVAEGCSGDFILNLIFYGALISVSRH